MNKKIEGTVNTYYRDDDYYCVEKLSNFDKHTSEWMLISLIDAQYKLKKQQSLK